MDDPEIKYIFILIAMIVVLIIVTLWLLYRERGRTYKKIGTYVDGFGAHYELYGDGKAKVRESNGNKTTTYWTSTIKNDTPCILIMRGNKMRTFYAVGNRLHRYKEE